MKKSNRNKKHGNKKQVAFDINNFVKIFGSAFESETSPLASTSKQAETAMYVCHATPLTFSETAALEIERIHDLPTPASYDEFEPHARRFAAASLAYNFYTPYDEALILPPADTLEAFYLYQLLESVTPDDVLMPQNMALHLMYLGWIERVHPVSGGHVFAVLDQDAICAAFPKFSERYCSNGIANLTYQPESQVMLDWAQTVRDYRSAIYQRSKSQADTVQAAV